MEYDIDTTMVHRAREFAIQAHGDQLYGQAPYSFHLDMVASHVKPFGVQHQVIAYLHDTIEDTSVTQQDVQQQFGEFVAQCVALLSDEPGENRKARKLLTNLKLAAVTGEYEIVLIVKAADRLSNLSSSMLEGRADLVRMYKSEHAELKRAIYRPGLCDDLWDQMEALLPIELSETGKPARKNSI